MLLMDMDSPNRLPLHRPHTLTLSLTWLLRSEQQRMQCVRQRLQQRQQRHQAMQMQRQRQRRQRQRQQHSKGPTVNAEVRPVARICGLGTVVKLDCEAPSQRVDPEPAPPSYLNITSISSIIPQSVKSRAAHTQLGSTSGRLGAHPCF